MSDRNVERNFEEYSGVYDKVAAGERVVMSAGTIIVGVDAVA